MGVKVHAEYVHITRDPVRYCCKHCDQFCAKYYVTYRRHVLKHSKGISGKYQKRVTFQQLTEGYARKREVSDRPGCISWECSECKKSFSTKYTVQIHAEKVHLPKDPGRYTCNQCDYKSHSLEALLRHKCWHANGEKGRRSKNLDTFRFKEETKEFENVVVSERFKIKNCAVKLKKLRMALSSRLEE